MSRVSKKCLMSLYKCVTLFSLKQINLHLPCFHWLEQQQNQTNSGYFFFSNVIIRQNLYQTNIYKTVR